MLLHLIAEQLRHGYEPIRAIKEPTAGEYAPSLGVIYATLTLLDETGMVEEQQSEGARKRFAITDAGRAHLAERREEADALLARFAAVGTHRRKKDRTPIRRGAAQLRLACAAMISR